MTIKDCEYQNIKFKFLAKIRENLELIKRELSDDFEQLPDDDQYRSEYFLQFCIGGEFLHSMPRKGNKGGIRDDGITPSRLPRTTQCF